MSYLCIPVHSRLQFWSHCPTELKRLSQVENDKSDSRFQWSFVKGMSEILNFYRISCKILNSNDILWRIIIVFSNLDEDKTIDDMTKSE